MNFKQKNQTKIHLYPPDPPHPFSHRIPFSKAETVDSSFNLTKFQYFLKLVKTKSIFAAFYS
jgi:hypothetical protein